MQRRVVYYRGRVQGVGFRFTAQHLARGFSVTGSVRNLSDGRVHLVVEGEADELERYLQALAAHMGTCIHECQMHALPATGEFARFEIGPTGPD